MALVPCRVDLPAEPRVPEAKHGLSELQGAMLSMAPVMRGTAIGPRGRGARPAGETWFVGPSSPRCRCPQRSGGPLGQLCHQSDPHGTLLPGRSPRAALVVLPSGLEPCAPWPGYVRPAPRLSTPLWRGRAGTTVKCPHRGGFCKHQRPRPWSWPGAPSPSSSHVGGSTPGELPQPPSSRSLALASPGALECSA